MKARLYRFENGQYGVQRRVACLFWFFVMEPDEIGNEINKCGGHSMVLQRKSREEAQVIVDDINQSGVVK